jgi:Kef-type K+ transport system membrane component KefB
MRGRGILTVSAFALALALAYLSGLVGLAPIVGAFAAGLVLASTSDRVRISEQIQPVADIFAPVFFATVGMQVDLARLSPARPENWPILGLAIALLAVAIPTKLAAGLGVVRQKVDRLAVGIAMVPRGEVGLIFATIGLQKGILSRELYGAVVLVVLVTTVVTPPWLKHRLSRTHGGEEAVSRAE